MISQNLIFLILRSKQITNISNVKRKMPVRELFGYIVCLTVQSAKGFHFSQQPPWLANQPEQAYIQPA